MTLQLPLVAGKGTLQHYMLTVQAAAAAKHKEPSSTGGKSVS